MNRQFSALADPTRRDLVARLRKGPATVTDLAAAYPVSRAAVSQHLSVLERAELVTRTRRGKWMHCALTPTALDPVFTWLADQRAQWNDRLDRLEAHLADSSQHDPHTKETTNG